MRRPTSATERHPRRLRPHLAPTVAGVVAVAVGLACCGQGGPGSSAGRLEPTLFVGYGSNLRRAAPEPGASGAVSPAVGSFTIAGGTRGLYPGKTRSFVLTVSNPFAVAITVRSITTAVSNASTSCLGANVKVTTFSGSLRVPSHGSAKTTVRATMRHAAPNACQGRRFPFHYKGTAT